MGQRQKRPWFVLPLRATSIALSAYLAIGAAVIALRLAADVGADSAALSPRTTLDQSIRGLSAATAVLLLATALPLALASYRRTRIGCQRTLGVAFVSFLMSLSCIAGNRWLRNQFVHPPTQVIADVEVKQTSAVEALAALPPPPPAEPLPLAMTAVEPRQLPAMNASWRPSAQSPAAPPGPPAPTGPPAPDFTTTLLDGRSVRLSEQRGRVVLVNFFATWCGPCQMELPRLQQIWNEFSANPSFAMLVIGRGETPGNLYNFAASRNYTFPLAVDPHSQAFAGFASQSIPRTYLISREGRIIFQSVGYREEEVAQLVSLLRSELARR